MKTALLRMITNPAAGIIARGDFLLKSGARSDIYINMRMCQGYPEIMAAVAEEIAAECKSMIAGAIDHPDDIYIVGVPTGATALAALVAARLALPTCLIYKEPKVHGSGRRIEGGTPARAIIVEDVYTTGGSIRDCAAVLEAVGTRIIGVVVAVCRNEMTALPWPSRALFTLADLRAGTDSLTNSMMDSVNAINRPKIDLRKYLHEGNRVILAMDAPVDLEPLLPWIAGVKVHSDLLPLSKSQWQTLHDAKKFILEDRKIADIGAIALRQIAAIAAGPTPPDAITVHGLTLSRWALESALPIVAIRELSCESIITPAYTAAVDRIVAEIPTVVGVVTQSAAPSSLPTFTPGINMSAEMDSRGQQYKTGSSSDFIIVGRGIYSAASPLDAAKKYARGILAQDKPAASL